MPYIDLTPEMVEAGTNEAIERSRAVLDELVAPKDQRTFENTMRPLDRINDILGTRSTTSASWDTCTRTRR
jgi:Zn-dependent oligopeptidase